MLQSRGPLWVLNTFEHDFVVKVLVVITWWHTWKKSFPHGSKLPALSIFGNTALTRQSLKFYHLGISLSEPQKKTFLCSLLGASKIWSSCNSFWHSETLGSKWYLKVSLLSEVLVFSRSRRLFLDLPFALGIYIPIIRSLSPLSINHSFTIASFHQSFL